MTLGTGVGPAYPNPKRQRGVLARRSRSGFGLRCESCDYQNPKRERGAVFLRHRGDPPVADVSYGRDFG